MNFPISYIQKQQHGSRPKFEKRKCNVT